MKKPIAAPFYPGLLRCLIYSVLEGGHNYKNIGLEMGVTIRSDSEKWQEQLVVSANAREAITENRSGQLDESCLIQKKKWLENTYRKCARLLRNLFNDTYAVYLLRAHIY